MSGRIDRRALLAIAVSVAVLIGSSAQADEVRTYQFLDTGQASLRFGGGLISGTSFASPAGTFDVTIRDDGWATITRFDVDVVNVVIESNGASLLQEGERLENYFFGIEPVGLQAQLDSSVLFSSHAPASKPIDFFSSNDAYLGIMLSGLQERDATVHVFAWPAHRLDNPSLSTMETGISATLVAVPEPCGSILFTSVCFLLLSKRRLLRVV